MPGDNGCGQPVGPAGVSNGNIRPLPVQQIRERAAGADDRVGTADTNGAQHFARRTRGPHLLREPSVETDRERGLGRAVQETRLRALGDDALDAAIEIARAEVQNLHRRQIRRLGTLIVSRGSTRSLSLTLMEVILPSTMRSMVIRFLAACSA